MRSTAEMAANDPRTNEYFKRAWLEKSAGNSSGPLAMTLSRHFLFHLAVPRVAVPDVGPWAWLFSAAALNVAPGAPYQHCNKNSGEQLNVGFNSSRTTEAQKKKRRNRNNHRRLPQSVCPSFIGSPTRSVTVESLGQVKAYLDSFTN